MKLSKIIAFIFFSTTIIAQTKELRTLPKYDCSLKKVMAIIGRKTNIVSSDNGKGLENILTDYCTVFGDNCIRKKESDLSKEDFSKDILLVGELTDFKNWSSFQTQINQIPTGFSINKKKFKDKLDGFVYVDTNRIIISGNSLLAVKNAQLALNGGHDILITQKGKITFFGNRKGQKFDWYNLQNLKKTNYNKKKSDLFSAIYISKTYKDTIEYQKLNDEINSYARQYLDLYHLKMPIKKVSWFLHSNMEEYGTMSGMFGLTCPGNNSAGFSIREEIHTNGFNLGLVKHEYSHFLFDNTIPQDNNPAFFVEGCVEYVTNLNDQKLYNDRLVIAKSNSDALNYDDLIDKNKDFYGQNSNANYSICGIFVKFIIDTYGVESFKKYCLSANKKIDAETIFKIPFDKFISEYKNWIKKQ